MTADDRLLYETRVRNRTVALAAAAGILPLVAAAVQFSGPQSKVAEITVQLLNAAKRSPLDQIGAVLSGFGLLAAAATLAYLFDATRARKELPQLPKIFAVAGAILAAVTGTVYAFVLASKSDQFASHGSQTYEQANHLVSTAAVNVLQLAGLVSTLLLAIGFVLTSLNAMRVGLLTRFMGYLGIFVGIAIIILAGSPPAVLVEVAWLLALAYLFSGRWPNGMPPAWRSGRAEPWPTSAEMREQRTKATAGRGSAKPTRPSPPEAVAAPAARPPRSATSKRKRKRRK